MKKLVIILISILVTSALILGACSAAPSTPAPAPPSTTAAPAPPPATSAAPPPATTAAPPPPTTSAPAPPPPSTSQPPAATGPLIIGELGPRTGWGGVYGTDGMDLTLAYADYYNARGGINGRQIKIVQYDDESEPEKDMLYVKKLIENDNALVIGGPIFTGQAEAAIQAARNQGVPLIYELPFNEDPPETHVSGSNIFGIDTSGVRYIQATVGQLKKLGAKTLAILASADDSGQEDVGFITEVAKAAGLQVIMTERIDSNAIDATPQVTKIKNAKPDAIHLGGSGSFVGVVVKGIKLAGIEIPVAATPGVMAKETFVLIKGYEPKNFIITALRPHLAAFGIMPAESNYMKLSNRMWDIWKAKYGESRGNQTDTFLTWIAWNFDYMDLAVEAIKQAGPLPADVKAARKAINDALENKIKNFEQILGTRTLTPTDHIGLNTATQEIVLLTVQNGNVIQLK